MSGLYHHGIEGQKWGQKNGPPYPLGLEDHSAEQIKKNPELRRQLKLKKIAERTEKRIAKINSKRTIKAEKGLAKGRDDAAREKAKTMSKEELEEQIKRLDLEKRYVDLMKSLNPEQKKRESIIRESITKALKNIGGQAATAIIGTLWNNMVENNGHQELTVNQKKGQKDK